MPRGPRTVTIYVVRADDAIGVTCHRFRDATEAAAYAATATYRGEPASAEADEIPEREAQRYGFVI